MNLRPDRIRSTWRDEAQRRIDAEKSPANRFHKPAGHHAPTIDPPPVHTLTAQERFKLMISPP